MGKVTKRSARSVRAAGLICLAVGSGPVPGLRAEAVSRQFVAPGSSATHRDALPPPVKDLRPSTSAAPAAVTPSAPTRPRMPKRRALMIAGLLVSGAIALMIAAVPVALGRQTKLRPGGFLETLRLMTREATVLAVAAGLLAVALWSGS